MAEYAIIGAGLQGTHIASELLKTGVWADSDELIILDECSEPLEAFEEYTSGTAMEYMRSHSGHHLGSEPYDLITYAREQGREDEFITAHYRPSVGPEPEDIEIPEDDEDTVLSLYRPSLDLFLDHSRHVAKETGLTDVLYQETVESIEENREQIEIYTDNNVFTAENAVLAVGVGETRWPEWAKDVREEHADAPVYHAFDSDFNIEDVYSFEGNTYIIGGSITAGQIAGYIGEIEQDNGLGILKKLTDWTFGYEPENAIMMSRHELEEQLLESRPEWTDWDYVEENLHRLPNTVDSSEHRFNTVMSERFNSTIPPLTMDRVETAAKEENLRVDINEVVDAKYAPPSIELELENGETRYATEVILATGFEPQDTELFDTISDELDLETGYSNLPILNDDTLFWKRTDGTDSPIHVAGNQAILSVGPFAGNIAGARLAAERITDVYTKKPIM